MLKAGHGIISKEKLQAVNTTLIYSYNFYVIM